MKHWLYEAHNLAPVRPPRGLASYYLEKEVQVVVVGLDLDIGMKLSMSRIPYEGAPTVCQAAPLLITAPALPLLPQPHSCPAPFKHLTTMILRSVEHL